MPKTASARRYAQAVYLIATEKNELDIWFDDLKILSDALDNQRFAELLNAPQVSIAQKVTLVRDSIGDRVNALALNLISLLSSRNIAHVLPEIREQYGRLLDIHQGVEKGEVISAVPLNEEQKRDISMVLSNIVGKETRLTSQVDTQIIGGIVARVGDRLIDGSTKTKLQEMRQQFTA
jgi:F-type H+-transporting ATPase subunit delta